MELARDQFIDGLDTRDLRLRVCEGDPATLDDAIARALRLEAIYAADRLQVDPAVAAIDTGASTVAAVSASSSPTTDTLLAGLIENKWQPSPLPLVPLQQSCLPVRPPLCQFRCHDARPAIVLPPSSRPQVKSSIFVAEILATCSGIVHVARSLRLACGSAQVVTIVATRISTTDVADSPIGTPVAATTIAGALSRGDLTATDARVFRFSDLGGSPGCCGPRTPQPSAGRPQFFVISFLFSSLCQPPSANLRR